MSRGTKDSGGAGEAFRLSSVPIFATPAFTALGVNRYYLLILLGGLKRHKG
ncbi:MAG: hypothetical protein AABY76_02230 [Planctomycetota bacterium]